MLIRYTFIQVLTAMCLTSIVFCETSSQEDSISSFIDTYIESGNTHKARKFLDLLEKKYLPEALFLKGVALLSGLYNNGTRNPREATIYFGKAAALKYPPAIAALADSYLDGDGAKKDEKVAFLLYKQAADLNDGAAQFNVAILYRDGIGTKKSLKMALKYMRLAAKHQDLIHLREDAEEIINEIIEEKKHK
ncbi:MAG: tetratricopeptide repeat protein [Candidatus Paracaedibacteraceae bacterium]|nr:tetratricopeptide repeat protein [Candidatus Paracaedibacteraceae bacterium]